jgi:hypothetical protein
MKPKRKAPALVYESGRPTAVLLDIRQYREMLDRLEDAEDIAYLERLRKRPIKYRPLEEVLADLGL